MLKTSAQAFTEWLRDDCTRAVSRSLVETWGGTFALVAAPWELGSSKSRSNNAITLAISFVRRKSIGGTIDSETAGNPLIFFTIRSLAPELTKVSIVCLLDIPLGDVQSPSGMCFREMIKRLRHDFRSVMIVEREDDILTQDSGRSPDELLEEAWLLLQLIVVRFEEVTFRALTKCPEYEVAFDKYLERLATRENLNEYSLRIDRRKFRDQFSKGMKRRYQKLKLVPTKAD